MRNRYKGKCELCGKEVLPKQGRWRLIPKTAQRFIGLRCKLCSTTTKKNMKLHPPLKLLLKANHLTMPTTTDKGREREISCVNCGLSLEEVMSGATTGCPQNTHQFLAPTQDKPKETI